MTDSGSPHLHAGMSRRERRQLLESLRASGLPDLHPAPSEPASSPAPEPAPAAARAPEPPTVLLVCTGNICRSPMAEILLRARLGELGVRFHSAGTHALVDHEMDAQSRELSLGLGATAHDAAAHRARLLTEPHLREADLILTMSREHRTHVVQLLPEALRRVFTLREFARLAATLSSESARDAADAGGPTPRERLGAVVAAVGAQRGMSVPASAEDDDVVDPYRRSQRTYDLSVAQLTPAIDEVERVVRAALRAR
ncbi:protein-tyrosine phosphatase, low mole cular weight [Microbacterium sp. HM58-2]|nr:protein-tyrosine phosphatase, low mole cular weight [Microbacterium sp. HM58-2]